MNVSKSQQRLLILNYHGIESQGGEYPWHGDEYPYVLAAEMFKSQMDYLAENGFLTVSQTELRDWLGNNSTVSKPVILTFDDGHMSFYQHAASLLKNLKFKAILFISAGLVGKTHYLDWHHIRELVHEGFEVGSHGYDHVPLTSHSYGKLCDEIVRSKMTLEEHLGISVRSFSIPRGFFRPVVMSLVARAGYEFLFTSRYDFNDPWVASAKALTLLKRIVIKRDIGLAEYRQIVHGQLGSRRYIEMMKEAVRRFLPPDIYDAAAAVKRAAAIGRAD